MRKLCAIAAVLWTTSANAATWQINAQSISGTPVTITGSFTADPTATFLDPLSVANVAIVAHIPNSTFQFDGTFNPSPSNPVHPDLWFTETGYGVSVSYLWLFLSDNGDGSWAIGGGPSSNQSQLAIGSSSWAIDGTLVDPPSTPLPGAMPLFAGGLAGLFWLARRRRSCGK